MATEIGGTKIIFGDPRQPKALPLTHPKARWGEFGTKVEVLRKGYIRRRGCLPLPCDILFERDQPAQLRDGTTVYVDIYRPVDEAIKCPALIAWSPYGKQGGRGNQVLDDFPFRMGVPLRKLSELQKWEGPDPAFWVDQGYAIINPDPRGVGKSEGNIYQFGSQEGRDGADIVDWIGSKPWCNGKVGLSGNSYLSISQWFIAAEQPKHLAAIAPWEGLTDLYAEGSRGGVVSQPAADFNLKLLQVNAGENSWENTIDMVAQNRIFTAYHDDKRARVEDINVPAYVVASWSNPIHTYGTFCGFQRLKTDKWLRVHDTWEWPDYYQESNRADLLRFFDYYLKGLENDWTLTARVRAKIIDTQIPLPNTGREISSNAFPPSESKEQKLFFDVSTKSLAATIPVASDASYRAKNQVLDFTHIFEKDTILCGPIDMSLAVSVSGSDDSNIYVTFEKLSSSGRSGSQLKIPYENWYETFLIRLANYLHLVPEVGVLFYKGPTGVISMSRRKLQEDHSIPGFPIVNHKEHNPVQNGEIVQVTPCVTPVGMWFAKGEKLRIRISGTDPAIYPPVDQATLTVEDVPEFHINETGTVKLHCGSGPGESSYIILPILDT